ncbi:MAG: HU family DNA-binding protein [Hespellia sp.]|nr:HU family DNA-binding protein [Hespellia sp.]
MSKKVLKPDIVKRTANRLKDTKITVGGNKELYKRKYNLKYSQPIVNNVLMAFMDEIVDALEAGETIQLNRYMIIEPVLRAERKSRSVYYNTEVTIPEQYKVKIRPGIKLEEACKKYTEKELGKREGESGRYI